MPEENHEPAVFTARRAVRTLGLLLTLVVTPVLVLVVLLVWFMAARPVSSTQPSLFTPMMEPLTLGLAVLCTACLFAGITMVLLGPKMGIGGVGGTVVLLAICGLTAVVVSGFVLFGVVTLPTVGANSPWPLLLLLLVGLLAQSIQCVVLLIKAGRSIGRFGQSHNAARGFPVHLPSGNSGDAGEEVSRP